ncbi:CRTAC1 family protein [soil metagenome]
MFTDVSHLIATNPPGLHYGVTAADLDGDGETEFFVCGYGGPNRVLKWINGELRDIAPVELADVGRQAIGVAAADFDGDGREELYILNTDTFAGPKDHADRLFQRSLDDVWSDLFARPEHRNLRNLAAGRSVAAIDRRGTGRYAFFVANYGRPIRFYELALDGTLTELAEALGMDLTTGGRGLVVAPLASDRPDIFCTNEHGANFLFRNTGLGTFAEVAVEHGLADAVEHGRGVTVLDLDGDGRLDLAYGNWDGPHRLMLRTSRGDYRNIAPPAFAFPSRIRTVIAADFDNDGHEEIFFNNLGESNRLFRIQDGTARMISCGAAEEPLGLGTGAAIADIDNDGILELLIAHGEDAPQPLSLYKVIDAGRNWLRVTARTRFGAPARGATVKAVVNGKPLVRVLCGGSGYLCQMEPVAHFGLGTATKADSISVTWPDGVSITMEDPTTHALIDVSYFSDVES